MTTITPDPRWANYLNYIIGTFRDESMPTMLESKMRPGGSA